MYHFQEYQDIEITVYNPFICTLVGIVNLNLDNNIAICSLEDDSGNRIVGFFYQKFADLLSDHHLQTRIPFKISIVAGDIKNQGEKQFFEVYQCIFEKDFLINSSLLASHSYCEMSTYLNSHIHVHSPFNPSQIFGIVYHDYLMYLFEDQELLKLPIEDPKISLKVRIAFQQAIFRNWKPLATFNIDENLYLDYFLTYFGEREIEFINFELKKLKPYGDDCSFQAEVMVRSRNLGLQGRVDRILWNKNKNSFILYETKTGRTSFSSENTAKFQLMAYSLILNEYYSKQLEGLFLEYPRNDLQDRLKLIEYDEKQIVRLINMRNQIWAISIGKRPEEGPFKSCSSECFQKDVCAFYCLRSFLTKHCIECDRCNYNPILLRKEDFEEFRRINVYYDWFYQFLEMEYLNNQDLLLELGLPSKDRESLGNCFSRVVIADLLREMSENDGETNSNKFWIKFGRENNYDSDFTNTRMDSSDYILITPQNYRPLTLQSIPGIIHNIQKHHVIVEVTLDYFSQVSNYSKDTIFRIDMITSNRIINNEKSALDAFLRIPYHKGYENLKQIRKYLINFNIKLAETSIPLKKEIQDKLKKKHYNTDQISAIQKSLSFEDLLLIQGPPGTGKTTVITEIVHQLNRKMEHIPNFIKSHKPKKEEQNKEFKRNKNEKDKNQIYNESTNQVPDFEVENYYIRKKILITAYTNRAVDTMVEMLLKKYPSIDILRIGAELSVSNSVKQYSIDFKCKKQVKFDDGHLYTVNSSKNAHDLINNASIIATTCLGANSVLLQDIEFEYVIIDEAGQLIEPAALIPILKSKRVILVGDDAQLPPISVKEQNPLLSSEYFTEKKYLHGFEGTILDYQQGNKDTTQIIDSRKQIFLKELEQLGINPTDTLSISLFQRLKRIFQRSDFYILLTHQYRMHKSICKFVSDQFYESKLVPGEINGTNIGDQSVSIFYKAHNIKLNGHIKENNLSVIPFLKIWQPHLPMIFLDTKSVNAFDSKLDERYDEMSSRFNEKEADFLVKTVAYLLHLHPICQRNSSTSSKEYELKQEDFKRFLSNIGIITPYRAQVRKIGDLLSDAFREDKTIQKLISKFLIVDTVDKFQGKECEIVLISLVDSNPDKKLSALYSELRRMNVSITRAKTKLIVIGNSDMFQRTTPKKTHSILDFFISPTSVSYHSKNKDNRPPENNLKSIKKIHQFFTNLVQYVQTHNGYVLLDENMITSMELKD
ncbi:MAG: AAA family ATPase [Candidatus Lokiarchaeota archaeon]|nr:AAA family ATPase [Candidatus Lokiarchaeota archaeon]